MAEKVYQRSFEYKDNELADNGTAELIKVRGRERFSKKALGFFAGLGTVMVTSFVSGGGAILAADKLSSFDSSDISFPQVFIAMLIMVVGIRGGHRLGDIAEEKVTNSGKIIYLAKP